jgi:NAD(P)-dependent dehydrogenase (short-subunit alcohol dehydrogenase family)
MLAEFRSTRQFRCRTLLPGFPLPVEFIIIVHMTDTTRALRTQVAVVTGGGRGIGAAIARKLAELGATTVITGRTRQALESAAEQIRQSGGACNPIVCDVTSLPDVERLATHVQQTWERADILVNNAGVGGFSGPLHELPPEQWDQIMNTNLRGVFYAIRAFAPLMIAAKRGHIINISSLASKGPLPNRAVYAASKLGLNGLTYTVAEELRPYNIRVAVVCPGSTHTDFDRHAGKDSSRMLQPEDIAHVVAMLVTQAPRAFASEVLIRPTLKP